MARLHSLPISIEQLISYRRVREKLVFREAEAKLPTGSGTGTIISYGVKYQKRSSRSYSCWAIQVLFGFYRVSLLTLAI
ncbi:MAG: hypothetical protein QM820_39605, partial [Minicystis sp.]